MADERDLCDLSDLVIDPVLKKQFGSEAWRQFVAFRMGLGDTRERAAAFMIEVYNRGRPNTSEQFEPEQAAFVEELQRRMAGIRAVPKHECGDHLEPEVPCGPA